MELGLPEISKQAIEQMRDHAVIQDDEFAVSYLVRWCLWSVSWAVGRGSLMCGLAKADLVCFCGNLGGCCRGKEETS